MSTTKERVVRIAPGKMPRGLKRIYVEEGFSGGMFGDPVRKVGAIMLWDGDKSYFLTGRSRVRDAISAARGIAMKLAIEYAGLRTA